jgi:hypothetical protein
MLVRQRSFLSGESNLFGWHSLHMVGTCLLNIRVSSRSWSLQHGFVSLPKSSRRDRLLENVDVGGFNISSDDMATLDNLDEHLVTDW